MDNFYIIVIILIIVVMYYNMYNTPYYTYKIRDPESQYGESKTLYANFNIRDICRELDRNNISEYLQATKDSPNKDAKDTPLAKKDPADSKKDSIKDSAGSKDDPSAIDPTNVLNVRSIDDQLAEQKKLYNELKLKYEDTSQPYKYTNSDLYLVDSPPNTGDDVFTSAMMATQKKNKDSLDARSQWNKNSLVPYLEEELNEHENSNGWWQNSDLEQGF